MIKQELASRGLVSRDLISRNLVSVLEHEAQSIFHAAQRLPDQAVTLVDYILQTSGRIVFSGMGKSGLIAKKLVATFSSTGTPALFLHPSEALHGDLGMVRSNDLFIALSKSGTGVEFEQIFSVLKMSGNKTALICCRNGALASLVDLVVKLEFDREACPLNLAPTSSSTLMLAFGDALAVVVSKQIGFEKKDFARAHPAGALGKQLLSTVKSFMYQDDDLPLVAHSASFQEVIGVATSKKLGVAIVVDDNQSLLGIVTDGDLRRACELGPSLFEKQAEDIMTKSPRTIESGAKAYRALEIMEQFNITALVVAEKNRVVGIVHLHDLIKAGIKS
ncbi:KpsF/GutQ family sugar-phosphate isomerase [Candidatus Babeliales bacterium]|nr:KpsF/GutQ family sugar-phosphate isomerase [Candidatus Babeliales bacterium]